MSLSPVPSTTDLLLPVSWFCDYAPLQQLKCAIQLSFCNCGGTCTSCVDLQWNLLIKDTLGQSLVSLLLLCKCGIIWNLKNKGHFRTVLYEDIMRSRYKGNNLRCDMRIHNVQ